MHKSLSLLCQNFNVIGIKCETEAEGSSFADIWKLRVVTAQNNLPLNLKIGGCEALNDIIKAYEIGVDSIIAPMIETNFSCFKFLESIDKIYKNEHIKLVINIETQTAVANLQSILEVANGRIDGLTVGRSDLSASYFNKNITQNSDFIFNIIKDIIEIADRFNIKVSVGGGVDKATLEYIKQDSFLFKNLEKIESRKVMFKADTEAKIFDYIMNFEKSCLLWKQQINDLKSSDSVKRLEILKHRY